MADHARPDRRNRPNVTGSHRFATLENTILRPVKSGAAQPIALARTQCYPRLNMEPSEFIQLGQQAPQLRFLIIGGYAVAAHGHTRATFDVDFLVRRADRDAWTSRLMAAGLKLFGETRAFAQFAQGEPGDGLDLMFVDDATFEPMWLESEERAFWGSRARVPSLIHLLALKLHALKQASPHRTAKDAEDVEMLIRRNRVDLHLPQFEGLFLKYGNREKESLELGQMQVHAVTPD